MADGRAQTRNMRLLIIVLGMMIILCSLAILIYLQLPGEMLQERVPLLPTLFVPP